MKRSLRWVSIVVLTATLSSRALPPSLDFCTTEEWTEIERIDAFLEISSVHCALKVTNDGIAMGMVRHSLVLPSECSITLSLHPACTSYSRIGLLFNLTDDLDGYMFSISSNSTYQIARLGHGLPVPSGRIAALCVSGTYLYVVGSPGFLRIHDVSNPQIPELVGARSDPSRRYGAVTVDGDRIYVAGERRLLVLTGKPAGIAENYAGPANPLNLSSRTEAVDLLGRKRGPAGCSPRRSTFRASGITCTAGRGETIGESEVRL